MRRFLVHLGATAAALLIAAWLLPDIEIEGGFFSLIGLTLVFAVVNAVIGPLLRLLSLPLTVITFGLFSLVVNGILLMITAGFSDALSVGGPVRTILAAVVISLLSTFFHFVTRPLAPKKED